MLLHHFLRGKLADAGLAAQQIEALPGRFQNAEQAVCEIDARDLLLERRFQDLRRQHHARAVRQHQLRAVEKRSHVFIVKRLIRDLRVRRHHTGSMFALKQRLGCIHRFYHRNIVKLQPHDICFHMQAHLASLFSLF